MSFSWRVQEASPISPSIQGDWHAAATGTAGDVRNEGAGTEVRVILVVAAAPDPAVLVGGEVAGPPPAGRLEELLVAMSLIPAVPHR